jgi:hypothetical protein
LGTIDAKIWREKEDDPVKLPVNRSRSNGFDSREFTGEREPEIVSAEDLLEYHDSH